MWHRVIAAVAVVAVLSLAGCDKSASARRPPSGTQRPAPGSGESVPQSGAPSPPNAPPPNQPDGDADN